MFKGLLEEPFNTQVMKLLYHAVDWHTFAKMCIHTETTIKCLEEITMELGKLMLKFEASMDTQYTTIELPCEAEAHKCRTKNTHLKSGEVR